MKDVFTPRRAVWRNYDPDRWSACKVCDRHFHNPYLETLCDECDDEELELEGEDEPGNFWSDEFW